MNVLFGAYRDWGLAIHDAMLRNHPEFSATLAQDPETFNKLAAEGKWDVIVTMGWSWKIPADIVNSNIVLGVHPSDLPRYAGGTPLQNQILDGVEDTKLTLFRVSENFDEGDLVDQVPLNLRGHMSEIFTRLAEGSTVMLQRFFARYPNNTYTRQSKDGFYRRRVKPEQSRLTPEVLQTKTAKQLYDFMRCREDPYPNVFVEDDTGTLLIKVVEFVPK